MLPMRRRIFSAWTVAFGAALVAAQVGTDRDARAQVVQLPAVQTFGYSGAVSVPDSGQVSLGGVSRQRAGRATVGGGPVTGRASGSQTGGSATSVSATIIDLQAMDAAILNEPTAKLPSNYLPRSTGTPIMNTLTPQLYARRTGADQLPPPNDPNAWEIALGGGIGPKVGPANTIVNDDSNVRFYMQRAKEASDQGRTAAAVVYYRMAYERLSPQQRVRLQEFQAKASAEEAASRNGTAAPGPATASSPAAAAEGNVPGSSAASSAAGEMPPVDEASADPFASPF